MSAGIEYVLQEMTSNGHVCLPDDELVEKAANVLKAEPRRRLVGSWDELVDMATDAGMPVAANRTRQLLPQPPK